MCLCRSSTGLTLYSRVLIHAQAAHMFMCTCFSAVGDFTWNRANRSDVTDVTYVIKGLSKDALYEFRVAAENRAGVGPPSEPAEMRAKTPICECVTSLLDSFTSGCESSNSSRMRTNTCTSVVMLFCPSLRRRTKLSRGKRAPLWR